MLCMHVAQSLSPKATALQGLKAFSRSKQDVPKTTPETHCVLTVLILLIPISDAAAGISGESAPGPSEAPLFTISSVIRMVGPGMNGSTQDALAGVLTQYFGASGEPTLPMLPDEIWQHRQCSKHIAPQVHTAGSWNVGLDIGITWRQAEGKRHSPGMQLLGYCISELAHVCTAVAATRHGVITETAGSNPNLVEI